MMKYPIPRPKKLLFNEGSVAASFAAAEFDPIFAPALMVFQDYATRTFGPIEGFGEKLILVLEPSLGDGYRISIGEQAVLTASNNTGMNYAFATLLQLATVTGEGIFFPCCEIEDTPDNSWRGIMLDLARCYHEIEYLYGVADLCWFYKISRFQLHLTDDQAVRFPFSALPDAIAQEHYTKEALKELIAYCKDRGITLVPEIDAPGHFKAFNAAYPDLFGTAPKTSDAQTTAQADVVSGIMRMQEEVFEALEKMFAEVAEVFTDSPFIHIGGDEAAISQWDACPISIAYRESHGLKDAHALYGHCVARLSQMILDLGRIPVVWEGFGEECNSMIPKETLVFSWESYYQTAPSLLKGGFTIINASWLPLYIVSPRKMWAPEEILKWEKNLWQHWWPNSKAFVSPITVAEDAPIAGGQLCVWGDHLAKGYAPRHEMLREEFSHLRLRLPALAEKTWTSYQVPDQEAFMADLARHDQTLNKLLK